MITFLLFGASKSFNLAVPLITNKGYDFYTSLTRSQFQSLCEHRVPQSPVQYDILKEDGTEFDSFPHKINPRNGGGVISWRDVHAVPVARIVVSGNQQPTIPPAFFSRPSFIGAAGAGGMGISIEDSQYYSKRQITKLQVHNLFDRTMNSHIITHIQWLDKDHFGYEINMKLKCEEMKQRRGRIEKIEWHGASKDILKKITDNGFDRWYGSTQFHGPGTYFAEEATTSHPYSRDFQQGAPFVMLLSKVLIGEGIRSDTFSRSQRDAVTFPTRRRPQDVHREVDSVNGDFLDRPTEQITVSYRDTHAMPIALVTYV